MSKLIKISPRKVFAHHQLFFFSLLRLLSFSSLSFSLFKPSGFDLILISKTNFANLSCIFHWFLVLILIHKRSHVPVFLGSPLKFCLRYRTLSARVLFSLIISPFVHFKKSVNYDLLFEKFFFIPIPLDLVVRNIYV